MKLAGIAGKGRGKLGSMIYKSVAGEQIVSQYQPSVSNPNSTAQVEQRARFKLMSQVAAAVSSCIAIPKNGLQSSRNLFVKKNMSLVAASEGVVNLDYQALQFTAGTVALPAIGAARATGKITVSLSSSATVNRVVYLVFVKTAENSLRYVESVIQTVAGEDGDFPTEFNDPTGDVVIYAYGMKDKNSKATAIYENYTVQTGTALASLILNRKLSNSSFQITATSGVTLFSEQPNTTTQTITGGQITYVGSNGQVYEPLVPNGAIVMAEGGRYPQITFQMNATYDRTQVNSLKFIDSNNVATDLDFVTGSAGIVGTSDDYEDVASTLGKAGKYVVTINSIGYEWPVAAAV